MTAIAAPMHGVYAFGDPDNPRYRATNHMSGYGLGVTDRWCCPSDGGHRTPRAAAMHLARRMATAWENTTEAPQ